MLNRVILIFFGGGVGAALRELFVYLGHAAHGRFPEAILAANLLAAFLIGLVAALAADRGPIDDDVQTFLATVIMGGLSTFSTLIWGTLTLCRERQDVPLGVLYLAVSLVGGLALVELGLAAGRRLRVAPSVAVRPSEPSSRGSQR